MEATFPVAWMFGNNPSDGFGGPAVDDAGTIYISREDSVSDDWPDGDYDLPYIVKKTSLAEMVVYCLDGWGNNGYTDIDHVPASDALAAALRKAADMLDAHKQK